MDPHDPVSVVFPDIFLCKMEEDVVVSAKPIFTNVMLMTDTYAERKINDELFHNLNSFHTNIKFILEQNPRKFLHTELLERIIPFQLRCLQSEQSFLFIGVPKSELIINGLLLPVNYIEAETRNRL